MFINQSACTVYEKTVRERAPAYVRHVFTGIYWEHTDGQTQSQANGAANRSPADGALCIIPAAAVTEYIPKPDDRIVCGLCEDDRPPDTALTVMQVKDFRYGSARGQHLEVSAV